MSASVRNYQIGNLASFVTLGFLRREVPERLSGNVQLVIYKEQQHLSILDTDPSRRILDQHKLCLPKAHQPHANNQHCQFTAGQGEAARFSL